MQSENAAPTPGFDLSRITRPLGWLFPIVLWAFATLFLLGDFGWWNDDYFFNQRDPVTGQYESTFLKRRQPEFAPADGLLPWRPIHMTGTASLITVFWDRPAVVHAVGAGIHLLCGAALFLFLRRLRISLHASAAVVCIHFAHASHFEAVLWASSLVTALAAAAYFAALAAMVEFGRTRRWWFGALAPLLTLIIAGCYEQPAPCLPTFALAYFAGYWMRPQREPWSWRELINAAWPTAAALGIMVVYTLNVRYNSPPGIGSDEASYVPLRDLWRRMDEVVSAMRPLAYAEPLSPGAISLGLSALLEHLPRAALFLLGLGVTGAAALHAWTTTPPFAPESASRTTKGAVAAIVIGLCTLIGACVPLAAITGYMPNPRTFYLVCAGALVIVAGAGHLVALLLERIPRATAAVRLIGGSAAMLVTLLGAVMYVGVQQRFALIHRAGVHQAEQLKTLVPAPPPEAVMVPLADYSRPVDSGDRAFDRSLQGAWDYTWQSWFFLQNHYQRKDVHGFFVNRSHDRGVLQGISLDDITLEWAMSLPDRQPDGGITGVKIPLARVVPFVIDPQGNVRVVTRWAIHPQDGGLPFTVEPPHTAALYEQRKLPPFEFPWPAPQQWPEAR